MLCQSFRSFTARRVVIATFPRMQQQVASRSLSTTVSDDLVLTSMDKATGVATVTMNRPPVNSLSLEMFQAISAAIRQVEDESTMQAMVLQSAKPAVFSAGLDLMEMHNPQEGRLIEFWKSFQQLYLDLYGSRLACVAALEGSAPAAGCMLALSCDVRIMASSSSDEGVDANRKNVSQPTIGLNESRLGIVAPPFLARQYVDTLGARQAALGLSLGTLYGPEEALRIGLVDQLVPVTKVREAATATAVQWAQIPSTARVATKRLLRGPALQALQETREQDVNDFVRFITSEPAQKGLSAYLEMMAQRRKK